MIPFDGLVAELFVGSGEGGADSDGAGGDAGGEEGLDGVLLAPATKGEKGSPEVLFDGKEVKEECGGDTRPKK